MNTPSHHFAIDFFVFGSKQEFSRHIMTQVPSTGDFMVFSGTRYKVLTVKWYLDGEATGGEYQAIISIGLSKQGIE